MKNFWSFYQNMEYVQNPFHIFGIGHFVYIAVVLGVIYLCFQKYKSCDRTGKIKWQRGMAYYFFIQEMFFYAWTFFSCKENPLFEVLQLELCTVCLFLDVSTLFHENKQVRFFGAVIGLIGGPVAMIYPATVAEVYPVFCYRLINFFMTHGAYILFSLMLLEDMELLKRRRLVKNWGIFAALLTFVYFFDMKFGTQYMFVGTPPNIAMIRMVYDVVGKIIFLPTAILIFNMVQVLVYVGVKKLQKALYSHG